MEVKIGVQHATRELVIDTSLSTDEIEAEVSKALTGEAGVLSLVDIKGRRILVPSEKLAYVELGAPTTGQVGFRS
ncbi:MAG: hypothetical protein QOK15_2155 [Nocardioidaceae bacterium]|jgi:hypothetical protein|nr:hypothetical protein [Nocardioidaceae bacterium]